MGFGFVWHVAVFFSLLFLFGLIVLLRNSVQISLFVCSFLCCCFCYVFSPLLQDLTSPGERQGSVLRSMVAKYEAMGREINELNQVPPQPQSVTSTADEPLIDLDSSPGPTQDSSSASETSETLQAFTCTDLRTLHTHIQTHTHTNTNEHEHA
jgi:hypothetical protein